MKRVTQNPVSAVESMLDACPIDEVDLFITSDGGGTSICIYPTSDDSFAAQHAVQIADGSDPVVQAAVIGLVHLHNCQFADQTRTAAAVFIKACTAGFFFDEF